jgi:hypothetical protein
MINSFLTFDDRLNVHEVFVGLPRLLGSLAMTAKGKGDFFFLIRIMTTKNGTAMLCRLAVFG